MVFKIKEQEKHFGFKKLNFLKKAIKKAVFPASAIALFGITVFYWNNQNYGLALEYQGQTIATMSNDKVYEQANHMIIDQLDSDDKSKLKTSSSQIKITPVANKAECCESPAQIKDTIIKQSSEVINEAYGIYVNGKLVAIGNNEDEINDVLKEIIEEAKSKNEGCEAEFSEKVELTKGLFAPEKIQTIDDIKDILKNGNTNFFDYTVSSEDTVVGIAEKFGMEPYELLKLNNVENNSVAVGDNLKIKTKEKVLNVKTFKIVTEEKEIPFLSEVTPDPSKEVSFKQTTCKGKNGKEIFTYRIEYLNSQEISKNEITHSVVEEPVTEEITVGTKKPSRKSDFLWPVPFTKKITSPYGEREGGFHKGIDIACAGVVGTDIVASESGTVKISQYSNVGYGNHIIIDHGNGKQTVYGHCQKLFVKVGQKVSQGDHIATVGSTGDSTGPHLHFEIRINGQAQNPQKYV